MLSILLLCIGVFAEDYKAQGADWGGTCMDGKSQSPIDLIDAKAFQVAYGQPDYTSVNLAFSSFKTKGINTPMFYELSGSFGSITVGGADTYDISSIRFHSPTEHTFEATSVDLEVQVLGKTTSSPVKTLILAKQWMFGNTSSSFIADAIAAENTYTDIDLSKAFPSSPLTDFYEYEGSLTTPPCSEGVLWLISTQRESLGFDQLMFFGSKWQLNPLFANGFGNNRVTKDIEGRTVTHNQAEHPSGRSMLESVKGHSPYIGGATTNDNQRTTPAPQGIPPQPASSI